MVRARIGAAFVCSLALVTFGATAWAKGPTTEELVGSYNLHVSHVGDICPEEESAVMTVDYVTDTRISMSMNGPPQALTFDPSDWTFSGDYGGAQVSGGFSFIAEQSEIGTTIFISWPNQCTSSGSGSKPWLPPEEDDPGTGATVTQSTSDPGAVTAPPLGVTDSTTSASGEDDDDPIGELVTLAAIGLLIALIGNQVRKKRRTPAPEGVAAAGLAGKFGVVTPTVAGAVSSDRMGGYENTTSYGPGAGVAAPAAGEAYEALVVAQAPRDAKGGPIYTARGGIVPSMTPDELRNLIERSRQPGDGLRKITR